MKLNGRSRSDAVQKPVSGRTLAGAAFVLLTAVGIGMVIREFRFRSAGEKHLSRAPKAVQPADIPETTQAPKEPETKNIQKQPTTEQVFIEPEPLATEPVGPPTSPADANEQSNTAVQAETAAAPPDRDPRLDDPVYKEQLGRTALGLIGRDPKADEVWIQIINDPSLPANARKNLIEDLNEDGLEDRRNPTANDQPVILYRIQLIEQLAPDAMDKTNADAFQEAYKDLVNLANRLTQQ
ncbi:MAG: hypothetical protein ABIF19_06070 [Planctomycetota bacterium]